MDDEKRNGLLTAAHYSKHDSTLETREENGERIIEGYAALYDNETNIGPFKESISRGAFDNVLDNDVRALINHDPSLVLGRTSSGTLELTTDDVGLKYRVKLGNQQYATDLYESIQRGDISQSSFAFTIKDQTWSEDRSSRSVDEVAQLLDVSPVTYPAYKEATVVAREEEQVKEIRTAEAEPSAKIKSKSKNKKMNLNDLKTLRNKNYEEHVALVQLSEADGRSLTTEEETRENYLDGEILRLDKKIVLQQKHETMIARQANFAGTSVSESKDMDRTQSSFSLTRAIEAVSHGNGLTGAEAEWAQEARQEMQARGLQMTGQIGIPEKALMRVGSADNFQATPVGDGSGYVPTNVPGVIEALRAPTMIEQLGATTIYGATGNLKFPRVSAKAAGTEETEVSADAASGLELDEINLTPTRVASRTLFSKQLILQGGSQVDTLIARELQNGINTTIDKAAFAKALTANDSTITTLTPALLFNMEKEVLAAGGNFADCKWAMSPTGWKVSRDLATVASIDAFWQGQSFDGFPASASPNLLDSATDKGSIIFGDFAQGLVLAFFGGMDLLVDPYSNAGTAQIALHLNKFYDVDVRQAGAFASVTGAI
jgi:HK97 family phage prohead protease/HK97 family phage major capsid protein